MNTEDMVDTLEELAQKLNGNEYGDELKGVDEQHLKDLGIVVLFGYSDDLMEFRGAISEEVGCCDGGTVFVTSEGLVTNKCKNERCPYFEIEKGKGAIIEALWCEEAPYSWTYKTGIFHQTFDIMEDGEKYCRGIIFFLEDAPEPV